MPVRQATRRYPDLASFLREYPSTLGVGALVIPGDALDGEPAAELRVDLVLPMVGRVGPLVGQVVTTMPDGGVALRVVQTPVQVEAAVRQLQGFVEEARLWLLETGAVVLPGAEPTAPSSQVESTPVVEVPRPVFAAPAPPPAGEVRPRGLVVPDLSGQPAALSGALSDRSLRDAMMAVAVEKRTGIFTLQRPDGRTRWGYWQRGGPVGWRTEPMEEEEVLGVLLYRAGTLNKEQLQESLALMERTGVRHGEALIEMGLCTFPQLVLMLQKQTEYVLQRALRERDGEWTFHLLEDLPERFLAPPLRVAGLLYKALLAHARQMPATELGSLLKPWFDHYVFLAPGVEKTIEEMKLSTDEQAFVQILHKTPYRLRELAAVSSLSRAHTAAAVWCLHDLNLIEFRSETTGVREKERFERDLAARRTASKGATLFERLDLHWICTAAEVDAAVKRARAEWGPAVAAKVGEQYRPALEEISAGVEEAARVLGNDASRREYRASIIEKMKIEQSAEMLAKKGEMAIMKEAWREAQDCFTKALELRPGTPEFKEGLSRSGVR